VAQVQPASTFWMSRGRRRRHLPEGVHASSQV